MNYFESSGVIGKWVLGIIFFSPLLIAIRSHFIAKHFTSDTVGYGFAVDNDSAHGYERDIFNSHSLENDDFDFHFANFEDNDLHINSNSASRMVSFLDANGYYYGYLNDDNFDHSFDDSHRHYSFDHSFDDSHHSSWD